MDTEHDAHSPQSPTCGGGAKKTTWLVCDPFPTHIIIACVHGISGKTRQQGAFTTCTIKMTMSLYSQNIRPRSTSWTIVMLLLSLLLISIAAGGVEVDCQVNHDWIQRDNEAVIEVQSFPVNGNSLFEITFHGMFAEEAGGLLVVPGWCVDLSREIYSGTYIADVFSSYAHDYHLDAVDRRGYLRHLTWLLNHYQPGDVYQEDDDCTGIISWTDYQGAIWTLMDNDDYSSIVGVLDASAPQEECIVQGLVEKAMHATITEVDCQNPDEEMAVLLIIDDMDDMILHQVMIAQVPVRATGICDCEDKQTEISTSVGAYGDPHFKMWNGDQFDFHGICDLVLLQNSHLDLDIHIRTSPTREWSFISAVAVRRGNSTLEVQGRRRQNDDNGPPQPPQYWLNQVQGAPLQDTGIRWRRVNSKQDEFVVELQDGSGSRLVVKTFWEMVRVDILANVVDVYAGSVGLMGSYNHGGGKVARNDSTLLEDTIEFGLEWQVLETEAILFHSVRAPQVPQACRFPHDTKSGRRRRLMETDSLIPE